MDKGRNQKVYNHYVPQFLLKNFSENDKSISMYIKDTGHYVKDAPIRKVAGSDYLYGENGKIEDIFCEIEGFAAGIIKKICSNEQLPKSKQDKEFLYLFFTLSEARTKEIADNFTQILNDYVKNTARFGMYLGLPGFAEFTDDEIEELKVTMEIPNLCSIKAATNMSDAIRDLQMLLIVNRTKTPFIIADTPVTKYNYYLLNCKNVMGYGWFQKGIIAIMPISNSYAIALVDTCIYRIRSFNKKKVVINDDNEIFQINKLFALQAKQFIYANQRIPAEYIAQLLDEKEELRALNANQLFLTVVSVRSIKNRIQLPFLKMKVKPLYGQAHKSTDYYRKHTIPLLNGDSKTWIYKGEGK
ncbi:DUF4238 domain-containing protein [Pseudoflavonifractor phocaeensis]|uniref:DUF4238 domain-containing protein n=1 Tax=Pseudoflavonifractor phocaeensis TaxID=1870988 RepID=UPI00195DAF0C|nr:DUF4238 domain-containing protein [Pseudoflavonifractor phocaeensis]MBM6884334.1 DUF4238 domain-containing protein [Pseudoflavonifractor phocaeensis]